MLNRREFMKLSTVLAAGAVVTLSTTADALTWDRQPSSSKPLMRLHGHSKSGCAFRPELVDLWAGGGAQLPDML
jgi:hypothetical protein